MNQVNFNYSNAKIEFLLETRGVMKPTESCSEYIIIERTEVKVKCHFVDS